ncbi:MAG TPA: hypothetical protein VIO38_06860, partial [Rariglobus sp.]
MTRILEGVLLLAVSTGGAAAQSDWPSYGHDPGGTRYSPLKQITPKNVSNLKLAWLLDTVATVQGPPLPVIEGGAAPAGRGPAGASPGRGPRQRRSESTPLVVSGVMYLSTGYSRVLALEPETGKKIWEFESP